MIRHFRKRLNLELKGRCSPWQNVKSAEKVSLSVLKFLTHTDVPIEPISPMYKRLRLL